MKALVDTDVWSEAFRRKRSDQSEYVLELTDLIQEGRVEIIGPIRMEILSGIRETDRFAIFAERLSAFPDKPIESETYVMAARYYNLCRSKGIQGSNTDFLICACSVFWNIPILSKDKDYERYQKYMPIEILKPRKR